jgi:membrane protease YdiL (CAAX protease family)
MIAALPRSRPALSPAVPLSGALAVAVALRVAMNGPGVPSAFAAGATFGLALIAVSIRAGFRARRPSLGAIGIGVTGGLILVMLPVLGRSTPGVPIAFHPEPFVVWVGVTVIVAVGEEAILRGTLFDALTRTAGLPVAVAITSVAFALIHVPLYGWHVVPLDLGVGLWLAGLRLASGGVAAPAIAHALADLTTWWM